MVMSDTTPAAWASEMPRRSVTCTTMCTITAETTSSADPWPAEMSQKARVRRAWRAVKSTSAGSRVAAAAAGAASAASPSTRQPYASGRWRMSWASGSPATMMTTPERKAVQRQPTCSISPATSGVMSPPIAMPTDESDSACARRRRNQFTIATVMGR